MTKLFEIPIYALSREVLSERYESYKRKFSKRFPNADVETTAFCIAHTVFPKNTWDHNHIVGYIDIIYENNDIVFEIYLPHPEIKRYNWIRSNKVCVRNVGALGTHFYVDSEMNNNDINKQIKEMLNWVIKDFVPKKYYVNREFFDILSGHVDYISIIKEIKNNGDIL